jgi:hypothetical protein
MSNVYDNVLYRNLHDDSDPLDIYRTNRTDLIRSYVYYAGFENIRVRAIISEFDIIDKYKKKMIFGIYSKRGTLTNMIYTNQPKLLFDIALHTVSKYNLSRDSIPISLHTLMLPIALTIKDDNIAYDSHICSEYYDYHDDKDEFPPLTYPLVGITYPYERMDIPLQTFNDNIIYIRTNKQVPLPLSLRYLVIIENKEPIYINIPLDYLYISQQNYPIITVCNISNLIGVGRLLHDSYKTNLIPFAINHLRFK